MHLYVIAVIVSIAYLWLLFGIAYYADKQRDRGKSLVANPYIYALSLGVYCTAWTFYGSVGKAAESGLGFLPVYLGPTLIALTWWVFLRKIVRIAKQNNLTSIADFVSSRYGKSTALGAIVTIAVLIGIMPYTALQLKAISSTFAILEGYPPASQAVAPAVLGVPLDTALIIALFMSAFGIMFGARHLGPSERHEGMVAAIAFESIIKLLAFLIVGYFVTFVAYDGFGDIFSRIKDVPAYRDLLVLGGASSTSLPSWFSTTVYSMMAVMFLPRQFHIAVVENVQESHIKRAMWLFPLYLLLINVFVLPIAFGGLLTFGKLPVNADFFVITLPMNYNQPLLALFAFVGGLSAATAMLVVESVAISTMFLNNLVTPVVIKLGVRRDISRWLITGKRAGIVLVIMLGYFFFRLVGESSTLVNLGLISFAAAFQFAPAVVGGLYFQWVNRKGAIAGLLLGFGVWLYTLMVPFLAQSGWLPGQIVSEGPFGLGALAPTQFLGLVGVDVWTHSLFWSLVFNLGGLMAVSVVTRSSEGEAEQADRFVNCFSYPGPSPVMQGALRGSLVEDVEALMAKFIGGNKASTLIADYLNEKGIGSANELPWTLHADFIGFVEKVLAGSVGPASAKILVESYLKQQEPRLEKIIDAFGRVSLSLEQSRDDLGRRIRELSILHEASRELSWSLNLPGVLQAVLDMLTAEFNFDGMKIMLAEEGKLRVFEGGKESDGSIAVGNTIEFQPDDALTRSFLEKRTITSQDDDKVDVGAAFNGTRSFISVPISAGDRVLGLLFAYSFQSRMYFSDEFLKLMQALASQIGIAVKNAQLYEELRQLSEDLENKVRDRTQELERAYGQLQEMDRLKSEFLSTVAHEFRTPLTSICSFSEILLGYRDIDPSQMWRFLRVINEEGERLTRLVNQVLDLSRIESGKMDWHFDAFEMTDVVLSAFQIAEPLVARSEVTLDLQMEEELPLVWADRDRVIQVLMNLLSNAVKVSPPGERVLVGVRRSGDAVLVQVKDRGPGVDNDDHAVIFEKFGRIHNYPTGNSEGSGLGLFISKQIVEHHGGAIWVESEPGGGAVFSFTLPIREAARSSPSTP